MNKFGISMGLVLVTTLAFANVSGFKKQTEWKCMDQKFDMQEVFKGFIPCAIQYMPKEDVEAFKDPSTTQDKRKEIGKKAHANLCIRVCQWKKHQKLLTEDGKLDETSMGAMIDKTFPEAAREQLKSGTKKCYEDNSSAFSEENNCESYKAFSDCMRKNYMDTCKLDHMSFDQMEEE